MNSDGICKALAILSSLALIISICSIIFCVMKLNDDYDSISYTLYIGLDGIEPYDENDVRTDIITLLGNEGQGYTLYETEGGFDMGGEYIKEKTLAYVINDCDESLIHTIVNHIMEKYGVGVLVEKQHIKSELYMP